MRYEPFPLPRNYKKLSVVIDGIKTKLTQKKYISIMNEHAKIMGFHPLVFRTLLFESDN